MSTPTLAEANPELGSPAKRDFIAYAGPFLLFLLLLGVQDYLHLFGAWEQPVWLLLLSFVLYFALRHVPMTRPVSPLGSIGVGVLVFAVWVGPDFLFPNYRQSVLFQNFLTGTLKTSLPAAALASPLILLFRSIRATIFVPVLEELFWRGFLLRWLIHPNFTRVPIGTYATGSFWTVAALFAAEHGPYWDVGLAAGLLYNWWMIRTKSLADCILAHAVTNGVLCAYVIATKQWQFWQ